MIDGLKALKKILLMDTCHSGELDKEDVVWTENPVYQEIKEDGIIFRNVGTTKTLTEVNGFDKSTVLMKELFTDLRKGTGATVVSSSGGAEFSIESDLWKNGLFTYCFISGLSNKEADANHDGQVFLSEIQRYVQSKVYNLSKGKQQPTSRIENIELDFRVW